MYSYRIHILLRLFNFLLAVTVNHNCTTAAASSSALLFLINYKKCSVFIDLNRIEKCFMAKSKEAQVYILTLYPYQVYKLKSGFFWPGRVFFHRKPSLATHFAISWAICGFHTKKILLFWSKPLIKPFSDLCKNRSAAQQACGLSTKTGSSRKARSGE